MGLMSAVLRDLVKSRKSSDSSAASDAAPLYIDLLKRCVSNSIYDDDLDLMRAKVSADPATGKLVSVDAQRAEPSQKFYGACGHRVLTP
jgi:hypothetical protein